MIADVSVSTLRRALHTSEMSLDDQNVSPFKQDVAVCSCRFEVVGVSGNLCSVWLLNTWIRQDDAVELEWGRYVCWPKIVEGGPPAKA